MRTRKLLIIGAVLALVATGCNADWTQFGGGAGNTRASAETTINLANARSMVPAWTGPTGSPISSSPAVSGGRVFISSVNGTVSAFSTGGANCAGSPSVCAPLWTASAGTGAASSPAVSGGEVLVSGANGTLYAFDAAGSTNCSGTPKTCAPLWTATTGGAIDSSPAVSGGVVYVGSQDAKLYAFDATGVTNCSGTPTTCAPLWTGATGEPIESSPSVANGVVYVGTDEGRLVAFDAAGGTAHCSGTPKACRPLWSGSTVGGVKTSPVVANGDVYVMTQNNTVLAFDAAGSINCTGFPAQCKPVWSLFTSSSLSSPAAAGGLLFVGGGGGSLGAINATTGKGVWGGHFHLGGINSISSSPAVVDGVVFAAEDDGTLADFDAAGSLGCNTTTGCGPLWSASIGAADLTDGTVQSSPAVDGGVVYIGSGDGSLHAFKATGSTVPVVPTVAAPYAVADSGEVTARWTPAVRTDFPITGYVVQPYDNGVAQPAVTLGPTATTTTLATSDPTASYTFTVAVTIAADTGTVTGAASPLSNAVSESAALAPVSYQIDPAHDGHQIDGPLAAAPSIQWSKTFAGPVNDPIEANGRLFVTVGYDGTTNDHHLYALDPATGQVLWGPVDLGGVAVSAPLAYEDHQVDVVTTTGHLTAYDEGTGALKWTIALTNQSVFSAPPTAYRGIVYVLGGGGSGTIYAVDGHSGTLLWSTPLTSGDDGAPGADPSGLYLAQGCNNSYRLDLDTGSVDWHTQFTCIGGGGSAPVLSGNRVYAQDQVLDEATGTQVASYVANEVPAIDGTLLFVNYSGTVSAIDTTTNATVWSATADGTLVGPPLVVGGEVIADGSSGIVVAYDEHTGAVLWTGAAPLTTAPVGQFTGEPAGMTVAGGRLFVADTNILTAFG